MLRTFHGQHVISIAVLHFVVLALALCRSLWWFMAGAATLLVVLLYLRRKLVAQRTTAQNRALWLSTGTILSLVMYSALVSVVLLTVRAALGWLEIPPTPFE